MDANSENPTLDKPVVQLKPSSYQPSKAELEEDVRIDTTPQALLRAAVADVTLAYPKPD